MPTFDLGKVVGPQGPQGVAGPRGEQGTQGPAGTVAVGVVATGSPGTGAIVTNAGTAENAVLNFTIPRGADGEGSGDMMASTYDPAGKARDIFGYVDTAIAAIPAPDISGQIQTHNTSGSAHQDIRTALNGKSDTGHSHTKAQITDFPASLPASDVYAWAKAASKPGYTAAEVGAAAVGHTHTAAQIGAAASSHSHGTGDITSGTLAIARGGTGVTAVGGTDYTTVRFRGSGLRSSDTNPTTNGTINWTYG